MAFTLTPYPYPTLVKLHGNIVSWEKKALALAPALTPTHEALSGRPVYVPTYNSLAQEPVEFVIWCGISKIYAVTKKMPDRGLQ